MNSTISQSQSQQTQFRNRTISQLVEQLNNLGSTAMTMHHASLLGILDQESEWVRRFRSRSQSRTGNQVRVGVGSIQYNKSDKGSNKEIRQSRVSHSRQSKNIYPEYSQFFLTEASPKKYHYHQIINQLEVLNIAKIMSMFQQNFNTTLIMQFSPHRFKQILTLIEPWIEASQNNKQFYASFVEYRGKQAIDLLSIRMARSMGLVQASEKDNTIYQTSISHLLGLNLPLCSYPRILKITKQNTINPQLSLILLPSMFFLPNSSISDQSLTLLKSQLTQILTYLKSNPNKKYESINKLLPKRYPTTTAIAELILYNSVNWVINWVADGIQEEIGMRMGNGHGYEHEHGHGYEKTNGNVKQIVNGRFQFYSKILGFSTLVQRVQQTSNNKVTKNIIKKSINNNKNSNNNTKSVNKFKKQKIHPISQTQLDKLNHPFNDTKAKFQNTQAHSTNQLQFCRSLQRKTHKYSIAQFTSPSPSPEIQQFQQYSPTLFPQTVSHNHNPNPNKLPAQLTQPETIAILKAQHARQISQYHQTIQNLNQKILILVAQKGQNISQIFKIYQREIMMLELKIKQLRNDISKICGGSGSGSGGNGSIGKVGVNRENKEGREGKQVQGLKEIIKRLNQQLISQKKNYTHAGGKISQGKIKLMQIQIKQWKDKYQKSEIARKQLKIQLQASTNRIKLKDQQTKSLHQIQSKTYNYQDLSSKQSAILNELQNYLQRSITGIPTEPASYILRKFKNVLGSVSELRQIILECHNFLTDLQEHIQNRLGEKDPEIVLDCNRFIRGFVIGNLDIF